MKQHYEIFFGDLHTMVLSYFGQSKLIEISGNKPNELSEISKKILMDMNKPNSKNCFY